MVDELKPLLGRDGVRVFRKNATSGLFGRDEGGERFFEYLEKRFAEGPVTFVVVGDCTDLCIYQNAMGIRLLANEHNARVRVMYPGARPNLRRAGGGFREDGSARPRRR